MNHRDHQDASDEVLPPSGYTLLGTATMLAKHKRRLLVVPFSAAVLMAILSFALPETFRANTKILPPQQAQSGAAALLAQLGGVAGAAAGGAAADSAPGHTRRPRRAA